MAEVPDVPESGHPRKPEAQHPGGTQMIQTQLQPVSGHCTIVQAMIAPAIGCTA